MSDHRFGIPSGLTVSIRWSSVSTITMLGWSAGALAEDGDVPLGRAPSVAARASASPGRSPTPTASRPTSLRADTTPDSFTATHLPVHPIAARHGNSGREVPREPDLGPRRVGPPALAARLHRCAEAYRGACAVSPSPPSRSP